MARMYPRTLYEPDLKSRAEKKVFAALEEALDDSWEVFHSAAWMIRDKDKGSKDGEIDFVLCHPEAGVLCLEVKGGGLECNHGEWHRIVDGKRERMSDPFQQAIDHRYALKKKLGGMAGKGGRKLRIGHALAFPDISVHKLVLAPDAPREIVIDRNDMSDIGAALGRALAYHAGSDKPLTAPGSAGVRKIREILAPELRIEVPLAEQFLEEQEQLITLTHEQALLLHRFGRQRRMVVTGPAGSGKTLLAMERAQRLADKGKRVLVICFNRALRDHLRAKYGDENLLINNFHSACLALAKKAEDPAVDRLRWRANPGVLGRGASDGDDERDRQAWEAVRRAVRRRGAGSPHRLVRGPDLHAEGPGRLLHLAVHGRQPAGLLIGSGCPRRLPDLGSDRQLPQHPGDPSRGDQEVRGRGRAGGDRAGRPGCRADSSPTMHAELLPPSSRALRQAGGTSAGHRRPLLTRHREIGSWGEPAAATTSTTKEPKPLGPYIRFSSIRGFKGLESPVVILCELEDIDDETIDKQLYVGFSRARNHCIVVAPGQRGAADRAQQAPA